MRSPSWSLENLGGPFLPMRQHLLKANHVRFFLPELLQDQRLAKTEIVISVLLIVAADVKCHQLHFDTYLHQQFFSAIV